MHVYDARTVANYLLDKADAEGVLLTNISINKILYFAHGFYYISENQKLIKNAFEAWSYGPVLRVVYDSFKKFGSSPVTERARRFNPITNSLEDIEEGLAACDALLVDNVFDMFSRLTSGQLIDLTHVEGSPWARLWEAKELVVRPGMVIRDEEIAEHIRRYMM